MADQGLTSAQIIDRFAIGICQIFKSKGIEVYGASEIIPAAMGGLIMRLSEHKRTSHGKLKRWQS